MGSKAIQSMRGGEAILSCVARGDVFFEELYKFFSSDDEQYKMLGGYVKPHVWVNELTSALSLPAPSIVAAERKSSLKRNLLNRFRAHEKYTIEHSILMGGYP